MSKPRITTWLMLFSAFVFSGCATSGLQPTDAVISQEARSEYSQAVFDEEWQRASDVLKKNEKQIQLNEQTVSGVKLNDLVYIDGGTKIYRLKSGKNNMPGEP